MRSCAFIFGIFCREHRLVSSERGKKIGAIEHIGIAIAIVIKNSIGSTTRCTRTRTHECLVPALHSKVREKSKVSRVRVFSIK